MKTKIVGVALAAAAVLSATTLAKAGAVTATAQRTWCIGGGTSACTTRMRLVCHRPGKTTLSRIPAAAFGDGSWRISVGWSTGRYRTPKGKYGVVRSTFSVETSGGSPKWALATVDLPTKQILVRKECGR